MKNYKFHPVPKQGKWALALTMVLFGSGAYAQGTADNTTLVLAMVVSYLASHRESGALDEAARQAASGSYLRLADGVTHYELSGPVDAPTRPRGSGPA